MNQQRIFLYCLCDSFLLSINYSMFTIYTINKRRINVNLTCYIKFNFLLKRLLMKNKALRTHLKQNTSRDHITEIKVFLYIERKRLAAKARWNILRSFIGVQLKIFDLLNRYLETITCQSGRHSTRKHELRFIPATTL